jgi:N-acetyl-1-D-myo-inositol-2-amino-2-deoxy-alpha-D-glucopyranoside deacetylase
MLTAPLRLLLVHAHPDDETLQNGGTIARYAALGVHVTLVTCTLGEEGEVVPPELAGLAVTGADQLGGYRVGELRAACAALGIADQRFLGGIGRWRDSGMGGRDEHGLALPPPSGYHPRAFAAGPVAEQTGQLAAVLAEVAPQVVIGYDERGGYGHPDHVRAHEITAAAVAGLAASDRPALFWTCQPAGTVHAGLAALADEPGMPFPVRADYPRPVGRDADVTTRVDVSAQLPAKIAALRAHATQLQVWEGSSGVRAYALADGFAQPLPEVEEYVLAGGADPEQVRSDLFGGLPGSSGLAGSTGSTGSTGSSDADPAVAPAAAPAPGR